MLRQPGKSVLWLWGVGGQQHDLLPTVLYVCNTVSDASLVWELSIIGWVQQMPGSVAWTHWLACHRIFKLLVM
jgi:predicted esterase